MPTRVAVDIGGTFTDLVHLEAESGTVGAAKASTTPHRFEDGVLEALGQADLDGVDFLAHGTTVIINALTERKGAPTALITTRGFRDVLEIQKANRPDLYNLLYQARAVRPAAPAPGGDRAGLVQGRGADAARRGRRPASRRRGASAWAEAVAISFLHSYAEPDARAPRGRDRERRMARGASRRLARVDE